MNTNNLSDANSRELLLKELIAIPSVTGTPNEDRCAEFILNWFSSIKYFQEHPSDLLAEPAAPNGARAVAAIVMNEQRTPRTVVLIAHYDVVSPAVYGDLEPYAFNPDELAKRMEGAEERFIYGRGSMDMKCGLAIEMELLRDFTIKRDMFGVNLLVLAVPDEENTSAGARIGAGMLARLKSERGLEYIAAIDTEPSEPGMPDAETELIFMGGLGKLMPFFYCRGVEAHVGNYYHGFSAALLSSLIEAEAEALPDLADPCRDICHPSWICLRHETLTSSYSVTIPDRSIIFFNCFVTKKTPADVMREAIETAKRAAKCAFEKLIHSHGRLREIGYAPDAKGITMPAVVPVSDIAECAANVMGGSEALDRHISSFLQKHDIPDMRDAGIAALEEMIRISGFERRAPFIACGFLPPYNPPVTSLENKREVEIAEKISASVINDARDRFSTEIRIAEFFAGICDLSFLNTANSTSEMDMFSKNSPDRGVLFRIPFNDIAEINMPVLNIGPRGFDAHKATERLDRDYSLRILPELLKTAIKTLNEI